jgi:hypothetical protein
MQMSNERIFGHMIRAYDSGCMIENQNEFDTVRSTTVRTAIGHICTVPQNLRLGMVSMWEPTDQPSDEILFYLGRTIERFR